MAELLLFGVVAALGVGAYRRQDRFGPDVNPQERGDYIQLPNIEPLRAEPHSIPWDEVNRGQPLPQENRMIQMNRPLIWAAKAAVPHEPPRVQRDPLYPDDLRAYDATRSRLQQTLSDSHKHNYKFGGYHIPYLAQNKTKQETAQSKRLSGRINNPYTTGGQTKNGAAVITKEPTAQVTRRRANHCFDDRSAYQVWNKKQHEELTHNAYPDAVPNLASIHQPNEHVIPTKIRSTPKYLNVANNQHGWTNIDATTQRAEFLDIDTMRKKKLILFGDQGYPTSQVSHIGGYGIDGNALVNAEPLLRRRDIHAEVSNSGLFQRGSGRTFIDENTGQNQIGDQLKERPVNVQHLWNMPHIIGEKTLYPTATPWLSYDPSTDRIMQPRGGIAWKAKGEPTWQADNAHGTEMNLLR